MRYPCEIASRRILPAFRSLIAKGLIENHGLTQTAAAERLGTTQAAISQYLSAKRGDKYLEQLENNPQAQSSIQEIVTRLAEETISQEQVMAKLCELCTSLRTATLLKA